MKKGLSFLGKVFTIVIIMFGLLGTSPAFAQKKKKNKKSKIEADTIKSSVVSALKYRSIGPAFTSGRIADFAVNPCNTSEYYVAAASGHVWKTTNNGTTFNPVFDNYGAYSMGCITMDPSNHNVVWIGTGENNHQRVLGYGNGVYKSVDGGKSWKNMGLKESRQIGDIIIHPKNPDIVYVAAEGSTWAEGGDRGLYKTIDGGKNWEKVLEISEHTGVNNIAMDPRDPNVIYATSEQRRRHVYTKIGGGPETAFYKTVDGGENWKKLKKGLPGGDMGGTGIAISPVNPDVVYAIIEATGSASGFYRSIDRGESWSKMGSHVAQGQYYNEIFCDPVDVDKVYSAETVSQYTEDAGKTWKRLGLKDRHVDDHAIWIDPNDTKHLMIGGDGGVYESFDGGANYIFKSNLPVTQFYRVAVDDSEPFYWIYGGTQDNNSYGGPTRNLSYSGVEVGEWIVTQGGDGFFQAIEPGNPNIVYSESQYGHISRFDKKSGESVGIRPREKKDEDTYKWNWNSPFIISPHSPTRLYMLANKLFRSDDRGNSWKVISEDITAQVDRNSFPVMGRYWGVDAVQKDVSTSLYGMGVSLAESKVQEGLVYVGTDDGVISVTEDNGENWYQIKTFTGVPQYTYVSDILPSKHDANVVYATFDNLKSDDFKPYVLKSSDKGRSWESISGNLPENGTVYTIEQDFVNAKLLFVGTEFQSFFSINEGLSWTKIAGLPDVAVKDITIQEHECDLAIATFGRGFYILDDYSPLREINSSFLEKEAYIFPIKDALMFGQKGKKYGQGSTAYFGKNPAFGATFTYYLKETPETLKQKRKKLEKDLVKEKAPIPIPSLKELALEENEVAAHLIFTITDGSGNIVRQLFKKPSKGLSRMTWDMTYTGTRSVNLRNNKFDPFSDGGSGVAAMPGKYFVSMDLWESGETTHLVDKTAFVTKVLDNVMFPAKDKKAVQDFQNKIAELMRVVNGSEGVAEDLVKRVKHAKQAIHSTPNMPAGLMESAIKLETELDDIMWAFNGQRPKASREENFPAPPSISERLGAAAYAQWGSTGDITQTSKEQYKLVIDQFTPVYEQIKRIHEIDILKLEKALEENGAPNTPGRLPKWNK